MAGLTTKDLIRWAKANGWVTTQAKNSHFRFRHPKGGPQVYCANTPGDYRSHLNALADLKRVMRQQGVEIKER